MRVTLLIGCTVLFACGGTVGDPIGGNDSGSDGTTNDGSIGDSGKDAPITDGGTTACPPTLPTNGDPCGTPKLACEYGSSTLLMCNLVATCNGGKWNIPFPPPGPPPPQCSNVNSPKCPPSYASVPVGQSCSAEYPLFCNYPETACACTVAQGGPFPADAAAVAKWYCGGKPSDPSCPLPRPKLGTACSVPDAMCDYGMCQFVGGVLIQCSGGVWRERNFGCPQ